MPSATLNGGRKATNLDIEVAEEEKPKKGNPMMKKLEPEMLKSPYPVELINGKIINSDHLCYHKAVSSLFEPLGLKSEKEYIELAKGSWKWNNAAEDRRREELANDLIAQATEDPRLWEILKAKMEEV